MIITCWKCGIGYPVADGADLRAIVCPSCKNPPTHFFKAIGGADYERACDHARRGEPDLALVALEKALEQGIDLEVVDSDPAFGRLRSDSRFAALVNRYRPK